ncbi:MAG: S-layer homology domain-containing protein [Candidatus Pristimantibacillus sp.]
MITKWAGLPRRFKQVSSALVIAVLIALIGFGLSHTISAAGGTATVNDAASLRNALASPDNYQIIKLEPGDYNLGNIPLSIEKGVTLKGDGGNSNGDPTTTKIIASGDRAIIINNNQNAAFDDVTFEALTITGGQAPNGFYGGGGINADTGTSTLSLYNVVVTNNRSGATLGDGGGMYVSGLDGGKLVLDRVVISNNMAADGGAGLYVEGDVEVNIARSTFENNVAGKKPGGAIDVLPTSPMGAGPLLISDSSFISNKATGSYAGALSVNVANTVVENSTFSGNEAKYGSAIVTSVEAAQAVQPTFKHVTISANTSTEKGGALYITGGAPKLLSSVVSGNTAIQASDNADITLADAGTNLSQQESTYNVVNKAKNVFTGTVSSNGNLLNTDAGLEPLADNGGFTKTHALKADSPARSAGSASGSKYDQRGFPRLVASKTAAGAFEGQRASIRFGTTVTQPLDFQADTSAIAMALTKQTSSVIDSYDLSGNGQQRTLTVVPKANTAGDATFTFTVNRTIAGVAQTLTGTVELKFYIAPDLQVEMTHSGDFYQGQKDAKYTIRVENIGLMPSTGMITLTSQLRTGVTATAGAGTGWNCSAGGLSCTYSASLAPGQSAVLTLTGEVANNASLGSADSEVTISGGGEEADDLANNKAVDATIVQPVPKVMTVQVPANDIYKAGDTLSFTVSFDLPVQVTGTPQLPITIGSTAAKASYRSGSGTAHLVFQYTVAGGMSDLDGIAIGNELEMNGGAIASIKNAPAVRTLNGVGSTSGILIDAVAPTISGIQLPANSIYLKDQELTFTVKFNEPVNVAGNPMLPIQIGTDSVNAVYTTAASATDLVFVLAIEEGYNDDDGITLGSALTLNGGSINDLVGNSAVLGFPAGIDTSGIKVDTIAPEWLKLNVPEPGYYKEGGQLVFHAEYSEMVTVTGTPRIAFDMNGDVEYANYSSGSGTNKLQFTYMVQAGDNDTDGLSFSSPAAMDLNGGTIKDQAAHDSALTLVVQPVMDGIIIDTTDPLIQSVYAAPGTYTYGSSIPIELRLSEPVTVSSIGSLQLTINVAGQMLSMDYEGASVTDKLVFNYNPGINIRDLDGIELKALTVQGAITIADSAGNRLSLVLPSSNVLTDVKIDTIVPEIVSISAASGNYKEGDTLSFTVEFNDNALVNTTAGTPYLAFELGTQPFRASYVSGSGTKQLTFHYLPASGEANGESVKVPAGAAIQANGGSITGDNGNSVQLAIPVPYDLAGVKVDSTAPKFTGLTASASGTYGVGDELTFILPTSEAVTINTAQGNPELELLIGGTTRTALYDAANSNANQMAFRYTVVGGDYDTDGIGLQQFKLNQAMVTDIMGNTLNWMLPVLTEVIKLDAMIPVIQSVETPEAGVYREGQELAFALLLNKQATVNTSGGSPTLALTIGNRTAYATFTNATGDKLNFTYTVAAGDTDNDGIALGTLNMNGAVIKDSSGNSLDPLLPAVQLPNIKIDTTIPDAPQFEAVNGTKLSFDAISFNGTAEAGSTIHVTVDGSTALGTDIADADGKWSVQLPGLVEGDYTLKAIADDVAGNRSTAAPLSFTIVPRIAFSPVSYSIMVGQATVIKLEATYSDGSKKDITAEAAFQMDKPEISVVNGTSLKGISSGSAVLTAQWSGLSATAPVTVLTPSSGGGGSAGTENDFFDLSIKVNGQNMFKPISIKEVESGHVTLSFSDQESVVFTISIADLNKLLRMNEKLVIEVLTQSGSVEISVKDRTQQAIRELGSKGAVAALMIQIATAANTESVVIKEKLTGLAAAMLAEPLAVKMGYIDGKGNQQLFTAFDEYVGRMISLGASKPAYGSAVLRFDAESGEFRYVPAKFIVKDGEWFAESRDRVMGTYIVVKRTVQFQDTIGHWGEKDITLLSSMFVVQGKDRGIFDPEGSITRAEFAVLLSRVLGLNSSNSTESSSFRDVQDGWYAEAISAAAAASIINGYNDGTFRPNATVSREEMAIMMVRALRYAGIEPADNGTVAGFKDKQSISDWAVEAVGQASKLGLVKGDSAGSFRPADKATRAEAATMLFRLMKQADLSPWE